MRKQHPSYVRVLALALFILSFFREGYWKDVNLAVMWLCVPIATFSLVPGSMHWFKQAAVNALLVAGAMTLHGLLALYGSVRMEISQLSPHVRALGEHLLRSCLPSFGKWQPSGQALCLWAGWPLSSFLSKLRC